jgi:hypothetical protein
MNVSEAAVDTGIGAAAGILGLIAGIGAHLTSLPESAHTLLLCVCDIILVLERPSGTVSSPPVAIMYEVLQKNTSISMGKCMQTLRS